eukprot:11166646-Lingulodinium_polyedra.AAC.1
MVPNALEGFLLISQNNSGAPGQVRVRRYVAEQGNGLGGGAQYPLPEGMVNITHVSNPSIGPEV